MKVYRIRFEVDDFRSLRAKDASVHEIRLMAFNGSSKVDQWPETLEAVIDNKRAPVPDIYSCDAGNMLLWGRSLELLRPRVAPIAELLPAFWESGEGFVVNVTSLTGCLDMGRTVWKLAKSTGKRLWITQYAFIKEKVPSSTMFKVKGDNFSLLCADHEDGSENLLTLVDEHDLDGISFEQIWES